MPLCASRAEVDHAAAQFARPDIQDQIYDAEYDHIIENTTCYSAIQAEEAAALTIPGLDLQHHQLRSVCTGLPTKKGKKLSLLDKILGNSQDISKSADARKGIKLGSDTSSLMFLPTAE